MARLTTLMCGWAVWPSLLSATAAWVLYCLASLQHNSKESARETGEKVQNLETTLEATSFSRLISFRTPCLKCAGCGTRIQASSARIRDWLCPGRPCPGSSVTTLASPPSPPIPLTSSHLEIALCVAPQSHNST